MSLSTEEIDNQMAELCCDGHMLTPSETLTRIWTLWLLINIAEGIDALTAGTVASPSDANFLAEGELDFSVITDAYQTLIAGTDSKLFVLLRNDTDVRLSYSVDGVTEHVSLNSYESIRLEPGSFNRFIDTPISVRTGTTGDFPTGGTTRGNAFS